MKETRHTNYEGLHLCIHSHEFLKWPLSNETGCIINGQWMQWANTTKLLKYLSPQCNTTLNYFISAAIQSDFEVFSCILLNSVFKYTWTVCWPLDVVTMIVREHWGWKLEMKKTSWCQNKDCLSPVERLNSNTLSCLESGFQLHAFWTCKKMFTNI